MSALTPDPVDEMLHSWDCETLCDLEGRITETKGRIEDFTRRGTFSRVEEEEVDLEQLLQTQKDIETILRQRDNDEINIVTTNDSIGTSDVTDDWERICLTPSFDEDSANSMTSGPSQLPIPRALSKNLNVSSLPAVALPPVGPTFKSLIIDKIVIHDYSGILDDLKKFDQGAPSNVKEMNQILQLVYNELHNDALKIAQSARTYRLGTTTALENETLINDLHTVSDRSLLFMDFVSETQRPVIGRRLDIETIVNQSTSLIYDECKLSLNSLKFSSVLFDFIEAEGMIKSAESNMLLLEKLADDIANDRKAQEPLITQVNLSQSLFFSHPYIAPNWILIMLFFESTHI